LAQSPQSIVVTSASSFQAGVPDRGSIGTIFCTGLNVSGTVLAEGAPLPWTLVGVSITIGGADAPLFSVSALTGYQQINFEVPQEAVFGNDGSVAITVAQNGNKATATAMAQNYPFPNSPGDFFTLPNSPYGAFEHAADYSLVTAANPAHAGETVIGYLTGLSGTEPVVPTGQASPYSPLAIVPQTTPAMSNFVAEYTIVTNFGAFSPGANITFLGLAPGLVGVYQVNFVLPSDIPSGDIGITLQLHWCNDACIFGGEGWVNSQSVLLKVG
jgi:uncharacterized protein (TIGR03437 family)